MNGNHEIDELRGSFVKQAQLFREAKAACRDAGDTEQVAAIERGEQAFASARLKAESAAVAKLEGDALKRLDVARDQLAKGKAAIKKADYKNAAPQLIGTLTKVAEAERLRHTCLGLVDGGACSQPSAEVENAIIQSYVTSWLANGNEGGVIRGPQSKDSAQLVGEVHEIWARNSSALNAGLAAYNATNSKPAPSADRDAVEAKVRGELVDAERLVPPYVRDQLRDPDSYEYVSGFGDGKPNGPYWVIPWAWKGTNAFGATVQQSAVFCVSAGTVNTVMPCPK